MKKKTIKTSKTVPIEQRHEGLSRNQMYGEDEKEVTGMLRAYDDPGKKEVTKVESELK